MPDLKEILEQSAARHSHLCPRQVLGARVGLAGTALMGMNAGRKDKRLLVIVETDGCFVDGIEAATGASVGRRTLRVEDYGKVAATFIDVKTSRAVRIAPRIDARQRAKLYTLGEKRRYFQQLVGYQAMPVEELLTFQEVRLITPVEAIVSRAGVRKCCERCGEEIINEREMNLNGSTLCKACAGQAYYQCCG